MTCRKSPTKACHYVFETPSGKYSKGACKFCGHVVMQPNAGDIGKDYWQWAKRRKKKQA